MSGLVAHMRWVEDMTIPGLRVGDPEVSVTNGPVSVAAEEIIRDIEERCGHKVRPLSRTTRLDGLLVRREFTIDVTLEGHAPMRWHHVVTRLADQYRRMGADQ